METVNVSIGKEVWEKFKKYCNDYNYKYVGQLTTVVKEHLDWLENPEKMAKQILESKETHKRR